MNWIRRFMKKKQVVKPDFSHEHQYEDYREWIDAVREFYPEFEFLCFLFYTLQERGFRFIVSDMCYRQIGNTVCHFRILAYRDSDLSGMIDYTEYKQITDGIDYGIHLEIVQDDAWQIMLPYVTVEDIISAQCHTQEIVTNCDLHIFDFFDAFINEEDAKREQLQSANADVSGILTV